MYKFEQLSHDEYICPLWISKIYSSNRKIDTIEECKLLLLNLIHEYIRKRILKQLNELL